MNKIQREIVKNKFGGLCAYSGTVLQDDWQIDHLEPIVRNWTDGTVKYADRDNMENLVPCQRIINHYKGSLSLDVFRNWYLAGLHDRLKALPKNSKSETIIRRRTYLLKVAELFSIREDRPFDGVFYFERCLIDKEINGEIEK